MILALTDHNVPFEDLEELQKEFDGEIILISGCEVPTTYLVPGTVRKVEVYINALDYDLKHGGFLNMLKKNKHDKREYIETILSKLEAIGIHVVDGYEELVEYVKPSDHVGRMAIVGSPYEYITIEEAVGTIRAAGGIPVLCHPYFYSLEDE